MKRLKFFLFFITMTIAGQAINTDSLIKIWNTKSLNDTIRLKALDEVIREYLDTKPDTAGILVNNEMEMAVGKNNKIFRARALFNKGYLLKNKENYIDAINTFLGSIQLCKETGYKKLLAINYIHLGSIYNSMCVYPKAIENYLNSLKIYEELKDDKGKSRIFNNIGMIYDDIGDYLKAKEYYYKALDITAAGDKYMLAKIYVNIGIIYSRDNDYTQAFQFFDKSKKLFEDLNEKYGISSIYTNIGVIYEKKGDYKNALSNYLEALKIKEEINNKESIALVVKNIGNLYNKQKNFSQAIPWCEKGLKLSKEIGLIDPEIEACKCLYDAFKGLGNTSKALEYYEQSIKLEDSLNKEETTSKLEQMEFQKKLLADSVKQAEIKLKEEMAAREKLNKQRNQKLIYLFCGIGILLLAGGLWRRLHYTRRAKAIIEKEKDRSENLLLNILPSEVAEELKSTGKAEARDFEQVSILFSDFKEFTQVSEQLSAKELVSEINHCFENFDRIATKYKIEKIKTIGDAYMAAGGLPVPGTDSVTNTVKAALEMQDFIVKRKVEREKERKPAFEMRVGIHTGPVVAGIVGVKKFQYDIWGDTVNTASRMESSGEVGRVNISRTTYEFVKDNPGFSFEHRGKVAAKNKGEIDMYFVSLRT